MAEGSKELYPKDLSLTNCDKEPIHIIGKIQDHGYLLVYDAFSLKITYCSENVSIILNTPIEKILGASIHSFIEDVLVLDFNSLEKNTKLAPIILSFNTSDFLLIAHKNDDSVLLEFEEYTQPSDPFNYQIQLSQIVTKLNDIREEQQMCDVAADLIKQFYAYDRVMIYRFDENWDGIVVSEAREEELESWLGLRYPASDIPKQARELFLKQGVRIISDIHSEPVSILALEGEERENPVDLTLSELRSSSPIHIEYLKNMNVGATLTAAIVSKGKLWGLIACHHYKPKFINYYERQSCNFLTQVFSNQLILSASNTLLQKVNASAVLRNTLIEQITRNWDIRAGLTGDNLTLLDLTEATGAALCLDDVVYRLGEAPEEAEVFEIIKHIRTQTSENSYVNNAFSLDLKSTPEVVKKASGVLCMFISKLQNDCLIWFKPEKIATVTWGGNPEKAAHEEHNFKISPRKSFEKWSVEQRGKSEPWQDYEIAAAEALRQNISEIILKQYEEVKALNEKLRNAYEDLETFSYSVAHDLRAPLRGIDGFTQILKEDYYDQLDDFGKSSIETIVDSAKNMNQLIDNILEFSRVTQYQINREPLNIKELTEGVLSFLNVKQNYPKTQISIQSDLPISYGDYNMIAQLLQNLLTNALKYTEHSEQPYIELGSVELEEKQFYFVKDNGIGFDQKHEHRIFKLFNRLVGDEYAGSGIGLTIVERIIKKHQGVIKVKSAVNQGTTFYFNLG
ncbi:ATP-binding protein [Leeuwenhoekiella sp. MAR_2009_132]|uniref:ATP-binding protein n=1 Tax=Leeuwenhoekiella sp. MAR_2009_132 TaxID=1392489 RepID=UPI00048CC187|nr:ATP-binding protein [Leeuwenhoekiella sp. MAR_2009_132]